MNLVSFCSCVAPNGQPSSPVDRLPGSSREAGAGAAPARRPSLIPGASNEGGTSQRAAGAVEPKPSKSAQRVDPKSNSADPALDVGANTSEDGASSPTTRRQRSPQKEHGKQRQMKSADADTSNAVMVAINAELEEDLGLVSTPQPTASRIPDENTGECRRRKVIFVCWYNNLFE